MTTYRRLARKPIALFAVLAGLAPMTASAQSLSQGITNIVNLINSTSGFLLAAATLAIMVVGYLWMTGRLDMMRAITITVGIGIVGAAGTIASSLVAAS